ncbi:MAG: HD domain-containing protein [Raoultibacter sp.]
MSALSPATPPATTPCSRASDAAVPYLNLDPAIEAAITRDRARGWHNPHRFEDGAVVRRADANHDQATLTRPAFGRDIEKIINVPAYNRYAGKTQVFSFVENDDISRRGLHVQLVSRIARNIGGILGLNGDLIEAIALGHDVGHTPFGHAGERFLSQLYHDHTGRFFNHNVHSVRVLDRLFRRNISLQTLDGVLCHNGEFAQQVLRISDLGCFEDFDAKVQRCYAKQSTIKTLCPSTLEACVVRISDMIAYLGKDRQDALDMGIIHSLSGFDTTVIGRTNAQIINNLTVDIINNSYGRDHIALSEAVFNDIKLAKRQNYQLIYHNEGVITGAGNIVEEMFGEIYERLLADCLARDEASPLFKHHVRNLVEKSFTITAQSYLEEEPNQIVVDYMASMTDSYFMALYATLFPESEKHIIAAGYCADL